MGIQTNMKTSTVKVIGKQTIVFRFWELTATINRKKAHTHKKKKKPQKFYQLENMTNVTFLLKE